VAKISRVQKRSVLDQTLDLGDGFLPIIPNPNICLVLG